MQKCIGKIMMLMRVLIHHFSHFKCSGCKVYLRKRYDLSEHVLSYVRVLIGVLLHFNFCTSLRSLIPPKHYNYLYNLRPEIIDNRFCIVVKKVVTNVIFCCVAVWLLCSDAKSVWILFILREDVEIDWWSCGRTSIENCINNIELYCPCMCLNWSCFFDVKVNDIQYEKSNLNSITFHLSITHDINQETQGKITHKYSPHWMISVQIKV